MPKPNFQAIVINEDTLLKIAQEKDALLQFQAFPPFVDHPDGPFVLVCGTEKKVYICCIMPYRAFKKDAKFDKKLIKTQFVEFKFK